MDGWLRARICFYRFPGSDLAIERARRSMDTGEETEEGFVVLGYNYVTNS